MNSQFPGVEGEIDLTTNYPIYGVCGEGKGSRITLMLRANGASKNGPFGQKLEGDQYFFRSPSKALAEATRLNDLAFQAVRPAHEARWRAEGA